MQTAKLTQLDNATAVFDNIETMVKAERFLETRLESACERNEWIATAKILYGTEMGSLVIEKFSKEPIDAKDRRDAFMSLCDFVIKELNIHYMENEKVFTEDAETIPNTINPYHYTITAKIDISEWMKKMSD